MQYHTLLFSQDIGIKIKVLSAAILFGNLRVIFIIFFFNFYVEIGLAG